MYRTAVITTSLDLLQSFMSLLVTTGGVPTRRPEGEPCTVNGIIVKGFPDSFFSPRVLCVVLPVAGFLQSPKVLMLKDLSPGTIFVWRWLFALL